MASPKTPRRSTSGRGRATPKGPRRAAAELDDLPGNDELATGDGVAVTLRDGVAAPVPVAIDRLTAAMREACLDLMTLVGRRRQISADIDAMVTHLRGHGLSWSVIGWCVGTTSEAARKRWAEDL